MTDKPIIVDGIDVSGCSCHYNGWSQLYRDNRDMCDKGYDLECKPKENGCYHYTKCLEEQLKRSEAQCEGMFVSHTDLEKKYKAKEQELEELRQYHNKCCEEFEKEKKEWLEKYNQVSRDFHNGKYCNKENCNLLKAKEKECERLKEGYSELTDIVNPYMGDFTGYNEEFGGFDIVLCVKELMEQFDKLKAENEILEKDKTNLDVIIETLKAQFKQLEKENERLKEGSNEKV